MGGKPPRANESDRPESGGTDPEGRRSNSGLQQLDKEKFAVEEVEKHGHAPEQHSDQGNRPAASHEPFSVGSDRNPSK